MQRIVCFRAVSVLLLMVLLSLPAPAAPPSQIQVARRFLLALLEGNWAGAYQWLSPEARQQLPEPAFRRAAQPIIEQARHFGPAIDLYKLGYRLRDDDSVQPFIAFSFKADTLDPQPRVQLDVTFRDSTARQVQGFTLLQR